MQCRIQFHDKELQEFDWCKLDSISEEIIAEGKSASTELASLCSECDKTIVFMPQQNILLTSPVLPAKANKQQLNAISYTIEEFVAEDIENCFFAILSQQGDNSVPVAVINRSLMDKAVELLSESHINTRLILPQIYLCPWFNDEDLLATICQLEEGYLIRTGQHDGLFCQLTVLNQVLAVLAQNNSSTRNRVILYSGETLPELESSSLQIEPQAAINLLSQVIDTASCINLKQKEYESSHQWMGLLKQWKWPMVAMLLLAVVFVTGSLINSWQKNKIYNDIISQQQQVLLQHIPDIQVTDQPKRQLVKMLADNQGNSGQVGFLDLLHEYSRLKAEFKAVETQKIQYQQSHLAVNLETSDLNSMESFRSRLQESQYQADIENVNISPDKTTGRLVMGVK